MLDTSPRTRKFNNYARMLCNELTHVPRDEWQETIAKRAYDLVQYVIERVEPSALTYHPLPSVMRTIPDMGIWPNENKAAYEAWLATHPDPAQVERVISRFRKAFKDSEREHEICNL